VHETSAGGLVIDGLDGPRESQVAALIGRIDRRGRMLWSLPKGHIEMGETAEQTAIREVAEETGIRGSVLAALDETASATDAFAQATRLDPTHVGAWYNLGCALARGARSGRPRQGRARVYDSAEARPAPRASPASARRARASAR